jgi:C1A family cysteine protease
MRIFNVVKDLFDKRDHIAAPLPITLPASVDLREWMPPIRDQGQEGACTAFAGTALLSWLYKRFKNQSLVFSPQFLYRAERLCEGDPQEDGGAQSRTMMACMQEIGVCLESSDPYTDTGWKNPTTKIQVNEAHLYKIGAYHRVQDMDTLKTVLASGYPTSIAIDVYESFEETGSDGIIAMPKKGEKSLGGHEICVAGYRSDGYLIIRNSWSESFADKGYMYMPPAYWRYVSDCWLPHLGSAWK